MKKILIQLILITLLPLFVFSQGEPLEEIQECGFTEVNQQNNNNGTVDAPCVLDQNHRQEDNLQYVNITPNPFSNYLKINQYGYDENLNIKISNIYGKIIINEILKSNMIFTTNWSSGTYFVVISSKGKIIKRQKIVLTR